MLKTHGFINDVSLLNKTMTFLSKNITMTKPLSLKMGFTT